jgi:hypothetical protein
MTWTYRPRRRSAPAPKLLNGPLLDLIGESDDLNDCGLTGEHKDALPTSPTRDHSRLLPYDVGPLILSDHKSKIRRSLQVTKNRNQR